MSLSDEQCIDKAIAGFPASFGLRAFPGEMFCISRVESYISMNTVMLYVFRWNGAEWVAFAKGTIGELVREVVALRHTNSEQSA